MNVPTKIAIAAVIGIIIALSPIRNSPIVGIF